MTHPTEDTALLPQSKDSHGHHRPELHHQTSRHLGEDVPLYARPRQRQRWNDEQILPHVNWGDLFFDLFYVSAAYNLAVIMKEAVTMESLLYFFCCYLTILNVWYEKLGWDARFSPPDNLFIRAVEVVHLVVLGMAIEHVRPVEDMKYTCEHPTMFAFALSMTIIYAMHMGMYKDLSINVDGGPEAVAAANSSLSRKLLGSIPLWVATIVAGRDYFYRDENDEVCEHGNYLPIIFAGLPFILEQAYNAWEILVWLPNCGKDRKELTVPMNLELSVHRLGELTNLMLGESVLALIIVEESAGRRYYVTFSAGIVAVTMMQYLYFRTHPTDVDDHAMRRSVWGGFQFFYSIVLYCACLVLIGCSYKLILHHYLEEEEGESEEELEEQAARITNMFSWSLAGSFFFMDLMVVSHRGWTLNLSRLASNGRVRWGPTLCTVGTFGFIVLTACLPCFISDLEVLSVVGCVIVLGQVLLRTLGYRYFPVSKKAMDLSNMPRWPNVTEARSIPHS